MGNIISDKSGAQKLEGSENISLIFFANDVSVISLFGVPDVSEMIFPI